MSVKIEADTRQSLEHKGRSIEVIQSEEQREKIEREIKQSFRDMWNNIRVTNEYVLGVSEREKREHGADKIS